MSSHSDSLCLCSLTSHSIDHCNHLTVTKQVVCYSSVTKMPHKTSLVKKYKNKGVSISVVMSFSAGSNTAPCRLVGGTAFKNGFNDNTVGPRSQRITLYSPTEVLMFVCLF